MTGRSVRNCREIVLVEGLFDWASLWQAGFRNVTCSLGTCLNATQFHQLCDGATRTVYLAFDSDANGSGQRAASQTRAALVGAPGRSLPGGACPMVTTPTASSSTAAVMLISFRHCCERARS